MSDTSHPADDEWNTWRSEERECLEYLDTHAMGWVEEGFREGFIRANAWQPIETAPTDTESEIIIWIPIMHDWDIASLTEDGFWCGAKYGYLFDEKMQPTMWKPGPGEPKA